MEIHCEAGPKRLYYSEHASASVEKFVAYYATYSSGDMRGLCSSFLTVSVPRGKVSVEGLFAAERAAI
jgi:hypothetical protein